MPTDPPISDVPPPPPDGPPVPQPQAWTWARVRAELARARIGGRFTSALTLALMLSGLSLLPTRNPDVAYMVRLDFHRSVGIAMLFVIVGGGVAAIGRLFGWRVALTRFFLYIFLIAMAIGITPFTYEMSIVFGIGILVYDGRRLLNRLRRRGADAEEIRRKRLQYADFAVFMAALYSGVMSQNTSVYFVSMHAVHGLMLPMLVLWFGYRRMARLPPRRCVAAGTIVAAVLVYFGVAFYHKQLWRGDERDLTNPDVVYTVERKADRGQIKPADTTIVQHSEMCGSCHPVQYYQWSGSAHRFSANNRFFKKSVAYFIEQKGTEFVRMCINCHDPMTALRPDAEEIYARGGNDNPEGVSCRTCHTLTGYDHERGNGLYTLMLPPEYPYAGFPSGTEERKLHDEYLLRDPRMHLRAYRRRTLYRAGEFCKTCHHVTMPPELTGRPMFHLHKIFVQWEASDWKEKLGCVECHLPRFQMNTDGYGVFDHRMMGMNTDLLANAEVPPESVENVRDFNDFVRRYIAGDLDEGTFPLLARPSIYLVEKNPNATLQPPIFSLGFSLLRHLRMNDFLRGGPVLTMELDVRENLTPSGQVEFRVTTSNQRVGHDFPAGLLDVQETWLEAVLMDANGREVAHIGRLDAEGRRDRLAPYLGIRAMLDENGKELKQHEFWSAAKTEGKRLLSAFDVTTDTLTFSLPAKPQGEYRLTVRWNFRRINPDIERWVWPDGGSKINIVELNRRVARLRIEPAGSLGTHRVRVLRQDGPPRTPVLAAGAVTDATPSIAP